MKIIVLIPNETLFSDDSAEQCVELVSQFRSLHPTLKLKAIRMMNQQPLQEDEEEYEEECEEEED